MIADGAVGEAEPVGSQCRAQPRPAVRPSQALPLTLPGGAEIGSLRAGGGPGSGLICGSAGITAAG